MSYYIPVTVLFTIQIRGGQPPYSVTMDYGDGTTETFTTSSQTNQRTHTYNKAGQFIPKVTVKDSIGQTANAQASQLTAQAPIQVQALSVTLTAQVQQIGQQYQIVPLV
jgi:PKD repeat protein